MINNEAVPHEQLEVGKRYLVLTTPNYKPEYDYGAGYLFVESCVCFAEVQHYGGEIRVHKEWQLYEIGSERDLQHGEYKRVEAIKNELVATINSAPYTPANVQQWDKISELLNEIKTNKPTLFQ